MLEDVGTAAAAPAAETAVANEPADLVGLFQAEIAAERGEEPAKAEESTSAPEEAAGETETVAEEVTEAAEAEPETGPEEATGTPAIDAPSGMTEAEKTEFAKLSPEMQSWVSKRLSDTQADYTRKTQAVADQRKAYDAGVTQLKGQLEQYDKILTQFTAPALQPPNPALRQTDPLAYEDQLAQYVHAKHVQDQASAEQQKVRAQHERIESEQRQRFYADEAKALAELAPHLAGEQGTERRKELFQYAVDQGIPAEMLALASAKELVFLDKAHKWDAHVKAKAQVKTVPPQQTKTAKPGPAKAVGRPSNFAAAVRNAAQSPTRENLAAAFAAELASER